MTVSKNSEAMPPTLEPGGVIRFRSLGQFASTYTRELAEGRVTALDLVQAKLFEDDTYMLVVGQSNPRIEISGMCVHRQGDVVGLQLALNERVRGRLLGLLESWNPGGAPVTTAPTGEPETILGAPSVDQVGEADTGGLLVDAPSIVRARSAAPRGQAAVEATAPPAEGQTKARKAAPLEQGSLKALGGARSYVVGGKGTLFRVLLDLQRSCRSGQLTVVNGSSHWSIFLDSHGCAVDFDVDLVSALIADGHLGEGSKSAARTGERLSACCARLSGMGSRVSLPPIQALRSSATRALVSILRKLAEEKSASYFFDSNVAVYDTGVPIPFSVYGRIWIDEVIKAVRLGDLEDLFKRKVDLFPVPKFTTKWGAHLFQLGGSETRFVEGTLQRGQPLRDLLTLSPLSRSQTLRTLYWLQAMDMLAFRVSADSPDEEGQDIEALRSRLRQATEGHFGALGLHVTAHHSEFRDVVALARETYSVGGALSASSPEASSMCRELLAYMDEALHHLSDQQRRIDYRRQDYTDTELAGFAQLLIDKMRLALLRDDQLRAAKLQQVAVELCPRVVRDALAED